MENMNVPATGASLGNIGAGMASRQNAVSLLKEMAQRKRQEADQLDALAHFTETFNNKAEVDEALWSLACGYLHR